MRGLLHISVMGALLFGATAVITAAPAQAQGSYSPYNESPAAALARYVHLLADDPKNFDSLIGAGRAAHPRCRPTKATPITGATRSISRASSIARTTSNSRA